MDPETDDARLWRFARFAAGTIMMRWFLDYPLPDVTIDVEGMHWTELEAMDEHMLTLHKILITCAGIMAACPVGVLPLAEQDNAIADDFRRWITPDFILEYQDAIHDAK